jgi:hypothetical protein
MLQVQTTGPLIADIPLPGTLPLAGTGLLGIAIAASRKRLA